MNDSNHPPGVVKPTKKTWLEKITHAITGEPQTKEEIVEVLRDGVERELLTQSSLTMLEGVLDVHDLRVKDVMVPRSQIIIVKNTMHLEEIVDIVSKSGHSRFPVIGENKDEILGILLAKDLLSFAFSPNKKFNLRDMLRNAEFIPESRRLDALLQDFRTKRNHMAVVVDEYGGITGLITIEDVIEQIVGDIADEHDAIDAPTIQKKVDNTFSIKALTTLEEFNEYFETNIESNEVETIGGFLMKKFGHLPKNGESIIIGEFVFKVVKADSRRIHLLEVIAL